MKFCPKCGKHYKDSTKFCSDCGVELNQGAEGASNFTNSIEEAGAAAKSALNNALSEENREKAKAAAADAMEAIKNADIEKGKQLANDGISKLKASKLAPIVIVLVLAIAAIGYYMHSNSDKSQLENIAEKWIDVNEVGTKYGVLSDGQIDNMLSLCMPDIRTRIEEQLKWSRHDIESKIKRAEMDSGLKQKIEKAKKTKFDREIEAIEISGDNATIFYKIAFDGKKVRQAISCRKINDKWYLAKNALRD